jgi:hypothetical protein
LALTLGFASLWGWPWASREVRPPALRGEGVTCLLGDLLALCFSFLICKVEVNNNPKSRGVMRTKLTQARPLGAGACRISPKEAIVTEVLGLHTLVCLHSIYTPQASGSLFSTWARHTASPRSPGRVPRERQGCEKGRRAGLCRRTCAALSSSMGCLSGSRPCPPSLRSLMPPGWWALIRREL